MRLRQINRRNLFLFIVSAAAVFYVLSIDYNYVGVYNDDAWYVNAARYISGQQHDFSNITDRPIGYPVLLAPLTAVFPGNLLALRVLSLIFVLSVPFMIYFFLPDILEKKDILLFIYLVSFSQFAMILSGDILSEAPFLSLIFVIAALYRHAGSKETDDPLSGAVLAALCAGLYYIRPQGLILFVAIFIHSAMHRKKRFLTYYAPLFVILILPGLISASALNKYLFEIGSTYGSYSPIAGFFYNAGYYLKLGIYAGLLGIVNGGWPEILYSSGYIAFPVIIFCCAAILFGYFSKEEKGYMQAVRIYTGLYIIIHLFWVNRSLRYMIPVYPFIIYYLMKGLAPAGRRVKTVLYVIVSAGYLYTAVFITSGAMGRGRVSMKPAETFTWVLSRSAADDVFYTNYPSRLFLHTGRKVVSDNVSVRDEFYSFLLDNGVSYVLIFSSRRLHGSAGISIALSKHRRAAYYASDTMRFEEVYNNSGEGTVIWKVLKDNSFISARELYRGAIAAYSDGNVSKSLGILSEALDIYPGMVLASDELASMYIYEGDYERAGEVVKASFEYYPRSPVMLALAGRILRLQGRKQESVKLLERALKGARYLGLTQIEHSVDADLSE